jgi:hypothetical protein
MWRLWKSWKFNKVKQFRKLVVLITRHRDCVKYFLTAIQYQYRRKSYDWRHIRWSWLQLRQVVTAPGHRWHARTH